MSQSLPKSMMKQMQFSVQVFVVGLILTATFFLLFVDAKKEYVATTSVMVILKSQTAVDQKDVIINNATQLPKLLTFYDQMLKFNPDVTDVTAGKSPDARKTMWGDMVQSQRENVASSVIKISIAARNQSDAEKLDQKTVRTLFGAMSAYYDVTKDIDLRVVDGPIVYAQIPGWPWMLLLSVLFGYAISFALQIVLAKGEDRLFRYPNISMPNPLKDISSVFKGAPVIRSLEDLYKVEQTPVEIAKPESVAETTVSLPEKMLEMEPVAIQVEPIKTAVVPETLPVSEEINHVQKIAAHDMYPNFPEMPVQPHANEPKAAAPDNLPIMDDASFMAMFQGQAEDVVLEDAQIEPEDLKHEEVAVENVHREPTEDELKKRLNQLLRGEI